MINICVQKGNMKTKNYLILFINNGVGPGGMSYHLISHLNFNSIISHPIHFYQD